MLEGAVSVQRVRVCVHQDKGRLTRATTHVRVFYLVHF